MSVNYYSEASEPRTVRLTDAALGALDTPPPFPQAGRHTRKGSVIVHDFDNVRPC